MDNQPLNLSSPAGVREMLLRHGLHARKNLGQHFLIDANVLHRIADAGDLTAESLAIEIGPGLGVLTQELARRCARVVTIERDRTILPALADTLSAYDNVCVVQGDAVGALKTRSACEWFDLLPSDCLDICCISNLPYGITSPVLTALLERQQLRSIVVLIQSEVADRLVAQPGTQSYGAFSVFVQFHAQVERLFSVSPTCFFPPPTVESAVVRLIPVPGGTVEVQDSDRMFRISRTLFGQRRKTLLKALQSLPEYPARATVQAALERAGIDPGLRGERLSIAEFDAIARELPSGAHSL